MKSQLKIIALLLIVLANHSSKAQYTYKKIDSIKVSENNKLLKSPWAGGFNAPQFGEIDLNGDNKIDLVVFDRAGNKISPFVNTGSNGISSYSYAPQYTSIFNFVNEYVHFADFNCDGMMDYITCFSGSSPIVYTNLGTPGNNRFDNGTRLYREPHLRKMKFL